MQENVRLECRNSLLRSLSESDHASLRPLLQPVELGFRKRLQSANRKIDHVFFPECGLASIVAIGGGERRQTEVAVVGWEGMVGLPIILGNDRSPYEIFMQIEGHGHSMPAEAFRDQLNVSPSLRLKSLHFAHVLGIQMGYTALANSRGRLEERLARWLLMAEDRSKSADLHLTHDFLALMLGVRRPGVTMALQGFEAEGVISTSRGAIVINDRDGLEEAANGLYGAPEAEFERLFG
jgi:CRP-like cAMP-binding protein